MRLGGDLSSYIFLYLTREIAADGTTNESIEADDEDAAPPLPKASNLLASADEFDQAPIWEMCTPGEKVALWLLLLLVLRFTLLLELVECCTLP